MGITLSSPDGWRDTFAYLSRMKEPSVFTRLERFGQMGVEALTHATPVEHNVTARAWEYEIVHRPGYYSIRWHNTHVVDGRPIAILLQYGHSTRNGGYVTGRNYIMPAITPIFDQIEAEVRKVVSG